MGRAELLFGEMASLKTVASGRHEKLDGTLPLRMQVVGRTAARKRMLRWRARLWRNAMCSKAGCGRASVFGLLAVAVQVMWETELWRIGFVAATVAGIALVAGAWAQVAMVSEWPDAGRN
jgi:hypothetical protein